MLFSKPAWQIFFLTSIALLNILPANSESVSLDDLKALPLPRTLKKKPVILTTENLPVYQDYLIAPLSNLVQQGQFSARLSRDPGQNFTPPALWLQASRENDKSFKLGPDGEIIKVSEDSGDTASFTGFPFGTSEEIAAEPDAKVRGKKLLWNLSTLPGIEPQALFGIEMSWFLNRSFTKQARGLYYREYLQGKVIPEPPKVEQEKKEETPTPEGKVVEATAKTESQLFLPKFAKPLDWRELLQLLQPAVIFGYASVTYRYRAPLEDDIWTYSPVLGRSRRVLESNRSDAILGSQLSLDDFYLFSTRPQRVKAEVVAEKIIFAPFSLKDELRLEIEAAESSEAASGEVSSDNIPTARGMYRNRKGNSVGVLWNAETGVFPGLPGWLPTTIQLSPRKVWVVETQPLDPFSTHGTEILFIDQQTFLPFYKVTYDRRGLFLRWSMAAWTPVVGGDGRIGFPAPLFILAIDKNGEQATSIETQYIRRLVADSSLRKKVNVLFDIREHDKRAPKKETPAPEGEGGEAPTEESASSSSVEDVHD